MAPPVVFGDYLLVAVNDTAGDSSLRFLEIRSVEPQSSESPLRLVQTISLKGHVDVGPSIAGQRLLLTSDNGDVHLLERSQAGVKLPLREVTGTQLAGGAGLVRFPLLQAGACLVGDVQLASFKIDPNTNRLSPAWRDASRGAVCQTPVAIGQTVFCTRHAGDLPGVVVSAVNADNGGTYWQTCLAAPLAGDWAVSPGMAVTSLGGVFRLPEPTAKGTTIVEQTAAAPPPSFHLRRPVTGIVRCGGKLALTGGSQSDQVLAFDKDDPQKPLASWTLPAPLACPPIAFAGGLFAALERGPDLSARPAFGQ